MNPYDPYAYYRPGPQHQPHQPQQLPAHTAQFLFGLTNNLPPLTPQERAMAGMQAALDNGYFDGTQGNNDSSLAAGPCGGTGERPGRAVTAAQGNIGAIQVRLPVPSANGAGPTEVTLRINANIAPEDFLAQVRANMRLPGDATIGYKTNDTDKKNELPRRLETEAEVQEAIASEKNEKAAKDPKPTECAYREELMTVKSKLRCEKQGHKWCFVRQTPEGIGEHVAVDLEGITLWAREMKNDPEAVPADCSRPPNGLKFDALVTQKRERQQRSSRAGPNIDLNPTVNIHLADTALGEMLVPRRAENGERTVLGKRNRDNSLSDEAPVIVPIKDLLTHLDSTMPALNFVQYTAALQSEGIEYCHQISRYEKKDLIDVGIARGAVADLMEGAVRMVRSKKRRDDAEEGDKENHA
ncbi:hypothetical protein GGX14DRAFT_389098 [Mycena pura]|uniref:SAM domain-containing protein n=1 Tax=Mycena pura TaxID=153505 RepID=A0AAD6VWZ1_9AGAR|nr:hypothetical protein GGX14DRAFT_389098 [Mycena pura]